MITRQYTAILRVVKMAIFRYEIVVFFLNFAQNIDQVRTDAVLSSTYNLSFRAKKIKIK